MLRCQECVACTAYGLRVPWLPGFVASENELERPPGLALEEQLLRGSGGQMGTCLRPCRLQEWPPAPVQYGVAQYATPHHSWCHQTMAAVTQSQPCGGLPWALPHQVPHPLRVPLGPSRSNILTEWRTGTVRRGTAPQAGTCSVKTMSSHGARLHRLPGEHLPQTLM